MNDATFQINVSKIIHSKYITENLPYIVKKFVVSVCDEGLRNCRLFMNNSFTINENIDTQLCNFLAKYASFLGLKQEQLKYVHFPDRIINGKKCNMLTIYCILS